MHQRKKSIVTDKSATRRLCSRGHVMSSHYHKLMYIWCWHIVAPGGSVLEDADSSKVSRTETCVFGAGDDFDSLKAHYEVREN